MSSEAYLNQRIEIKQAGLRNPLGLDTSLRSYSAGAIRKNHVMHPVVVGAGPVHGGHLASAQAATQETVIALSGARIRYSSLATADFNGATDPDLPWPTFRHNVLRNGCHPLPPPRLPQRVALLPPGRLWCDRSPEHNLAQSG